VVGGKVRIVCSATIVFLSVILQEGSEFNDRQYRDSRADRAIA
jgi:hypothetical protein